MLALTLENRDAVVVQTTTKLRYPDPRRLMPAPAQRQIAI